MDKVSVIIPTYNRFKYLLNTVESIRKQTYTNFEIIVVNDASTQKEYYDFDWNAIDVKMIHLDVNTKQIFGYVSCGYVRNRGIEEATGKYIAFCDDDDIWFSKKLELQMIAMETSGCKMCSTDGFIGCGTYDESKKYKKYNAEHYNATLKRIYKSKKSKLLENGFPRIWTHEFLKIHNCIIGSSVIIERQILEKINNFRDLKSSEEDYDCWLRALQHTDSIYIDEVCFYYDNNHGDGREY